MRKAVITGIGVICAIGRNREDFWVSLARGRCGIGEISLFDTSGYRARLAAQVNDEYIMRHPERRLSRSDMLGLTALDEAIRSSGLDFSRLNPEGTSVVIGSGSGGLLSAEGFKREHISGRKPHPSLLVPFSSSSFTDLVASRCYSKGMRTTVSTACSSSSTALGLAMDFIRNGRADLVITGGSESLSETTFAGFNSLRAVDELPCRPFDRDRKGISLGEGSAMFVVEEMDSARNRNARIYAEIAGYGIAGDAHHVTSPDPDGGGISYAMEIAFASARVEREEIGYINAHGTGTPANDLAETIAIRKTFGARAREIPVSSTKSMIGHCLGAAGALEATASIMAIQKGIIPPTANYRNRDPLCDLDYVPEPVSRPVRTALSLSLAFGGNNTALVLRSCP